MAGKEDKSGDTSQSSVPAISSENPQLQITTIKLNGANYVRWSKSVQMYIRGRSKIGYLTGTTAKPAKGDPAFDVWDAENSMVMTWLVNSMTIDIRANYLGYDTAKELWDDVAATYSDLGNQSQVYELTMKLATITQGQESVTRYYNLLKQVWQDRDMFNDHVWKSAEDQAFFKKTVDTNRIFKSLVGLNTDLDEVRGRIIARDPLPSLGEVFSEVRREETRRRVMLGSSKELPSTAESSALAAALGQPKEEPSEALATYRGSPSREIDPKANLRCDYCGRWRHTRAECRKLATHTRNKEAEKGSHQQFQSKEGSQRYKPRANAATTQSDGGLLSKEQLEQILSLLRPQVATSDHPSGSSAHSGSELGEGDWQR
ncbi:hypothetical protein LINPERPRIM_LOCUS26638 [Linum perenne]